MRANELWLRCFKARLVSWLNSDRVGATLPLGDGQFVIVAIYENGRYYRPAPISIPDGVPPGWGPDGPVQMRHPADTDDTDEDYDDEDEEDEDSAE